MSNFSIKKPVVSITLLLFLTVLIVLPNTYAKTTTSSLSITGDGSQVYTVEQGDSLEVNLTLPLYMADDSKISWESTNPGSFKTDFGTSHKTTKVTITPTTSAGYNCTYSNNVAEYDFTVYVTVPGTPTPDYPDDWGTAMPTPAPEPGPPPPTMNDNLYSIGDGTPTRNISSSTGAVFTSNGDYDKFSGVWIHGYAIPSTYYTKSEASDGTVTVTLDSWYMNSLNRYEEYLIHLIFDDGYAFTKFTKTY